MCESLAGIVIPDTVTEIGERAFFKCPESLEITVARESYAKKYCEANHLNYIYSDANIWLNP